MEWKNVLMLLGGCFLAVVVVVGALVASSSHDDKDVNSAVSILPETSSPAITYAMYEQIRSGMSYSDVIAIIGQSGEELSRSEIKGTPGYTPDIITVMYSWKNSDGSNMNAMFQNDKLVNKAQFGLK